MKQDVPWALKDNGEVSDGGGREAVESAKQRRPPPFAPLTRSTPASVARSDIDWGSSQIQDTSLSNVSQDKS